jgi:hypothetical protein
MRTVKTALNQRVNLNNPAWYKEFVVSEEVTKVFKVNTYQPERAEKEGIIADVVVSSPLGTFVFEGFYDAQQDCVHISPKYANTYVDKNGDDRTRTAVDLNYALHAYVLQVVDGILE